MRPRGTRQPPGSILPRALPTIRQTLRAPPCARCRSGRYSPPSLCHPPGSCPRCSESRERHTTGRLRLSHPAATVQCVAGLEPFVAARPATVASVDPLEPRVTQAPEYVPPVTAEGAGGLRHREPSCLLQHCFCGHNLLVQILAL